MREIGTLYLRITRVIIVVILALFTLSHLALGSDWVFIDHVNLALHEAGHKIFSWGGETLAALGGTLGQLMWPALLAVYFGWRRQDRFAMTVCVWWFGENFIGIARYMADAIWQELPLVGGTVHDWNFLFTRWDCLDSAKVVGQTVRGMGAIIMLVSLAYLGWRTLSPSSADRDRAMTFDDAR